MFRKARSFTIENNAVKVGQHISLGASALHPVLVCAQSSGGHMELFGRTCTHQVYANRPVNSDAQHKS
jgi:hypothetical protein